MSRSVYGTRGSASQNVYGSVGANTQEIYGSGSLNIAIAQCIEVACPNIKEAFLALSDFIMYLQTSIPVLFPSSMIVSQFVADVAARSAVSPPVYVRLVWLEHYKNNPLYNPTPLPFNKEYIPHLLQLKEIYLRLGMNFLLDPLFKAGSGSTSKAVREVLRY